ncbi:TrkH family potassium uptake protein [Candidatus Woesearchaeota archaeon]|nr:TrkH family potassium uptake protein [Candidatus Woesearchaeota archaeon]
MEVVLKYLGYLLIIFAVFPVLPIVAALYYYEAVLPFFAPVLLSLLIGYFLVSRSADKGDRLSITDFDLPRSISLSALSFFTISVLGAIPYALIQKTTLLDALFESVSGFTTTGLTIFTDVESVSRSLLIWRAETQWIGGLSIVLLFLIIVSAMRSQDSLKETTTKARAIANLYQAQGASEKLEANMNKSIRNTVMIYLAYTLAGIILLGVAGLTTFESVAISFTAISTAGFSVTNQFYTDWPVLAVVSLLMLAGGVSFVVHNRLFKGHVGELWKNGALRFYFLTVVAALLLCFFFLADFKIAFFEIVSAFTTTGYSIADISVMPSVVIMIIVCGMVTGGMLGSTCGGIKTNRLKLMLRSIPWMVRKTASPSGAIIPLKNDGVVVDDENMMITHAFIASYMLILLLGTAVIMVTGESFLDSSFQTVSALGGVGLSTTSPAFFHPVAKSVLIIAMLFGRLEIFPVLVFGRFFIDRLRLRARREEEESRKLFYIRWAPSGIWKRKL